MANTTSSSPARLSVTRDQLSQAARQAGLPSDQADRLWTELQSLAPAEPRFGAAQVAWYFGAAVILAAMTWLIAIVGSLYGSGATLATAIVYAGLFAIAAAKLSSNSGLRVPGGLLYV